MRNAPKAKAGHKACGHSELQLKGCQLCRSCRCRQHSRELSQLHSEIELHLSDDEASRVRMGKLSEMA